MKNTNFKSWHRKSILIASGLTLLIMVAGYLWLPDGSAASSAASLRPAEPETISRIKEAYGKLPLSFEENLGQANSMVKFVARGGNTSLLLEPTGVGLMIGNKDGLRKNRDDVRVSFTSLRMKLVGSNSSAQVAGLDRLPGKANYMIGNDPKRWRIGIPTYAKVRYREVYPGIDLIYYGNQQRLEYDFAVAPSADPKIIRLAFDGLKQTCLDTNGDLVLLTENSEVRYHKPAIYQELNGKKRSIAGQYKLHENNEVGFEIGDYDRNRPLVIDPVLLYSSFGIGGDSIAVDSQGNAYVIGSTYLPNFPTLSPLQQQIDGEQDVFVVKFNSSGTGLVYSTYLGGNGRDLGYSIAVDPQHSIYVTGRTFSSNFPGATPVNTPTFFKTANGGGGWNAVNSVPGGGRVYAVAVDPHNSTTIYLAALSQKNLPLYFKTTDGGSNWTAINNNLPDLGDLIVKVPLSPLLVIDPVNTSTVYLSYINRAYKTIDGGSTWKEIINTNTNIVDFVIDPVNLSTLYLVTGGSMIKSVDAGESWQVLNSGYSFTGIAVDPANHNILYLGSARYAYKSTDGGLTLNQISNGLPDERVDSLVVDYITPATVYAATPKGVFKSLDGGNSWASSNKGLPLDGGYGSTIRLKIDPINPSTLYAAAGSFGGSNGVYKSIDGGNVWNRVVDGLSNADVILLTLDPSNPSTLYTSAISDGSDAFVTKLNASGSAIVYSVYLAGNHNDYGTDLTVDGEGNAYVVGTTDSDNFPRTTGAYQLKLGNGGNRQLTDAFVVKLNGSGAITYSSYFGGNNADYGNAVAIDTGSKIYITGETESEDLPIINALQTDAISIDAFVAKIDPSQSGTRSFIYATYLGGDYAQAGVDIAADALGNAYVLLSSIKFPGLLGYSPPLITGMPLTSGAFQSKPAAGYLAKLNPTGSALIFSTYLGSGTDQLGHGYKSDRPEYFNGLALDAVGNIYIAGLTRVSYFPITPGAFQPAYIAGRNCDLYGMPCADAVVMKLNAAGSALVYSSFLGGDFEDNAKSIAVDKEGSVYFTGGASSNGFPVTPGAYQIAADYGYTAKISADDRSTDLASVSAASFSASPVAAESIVAAFGSGLANGIYPTGSVLMESLGDVSVVVKDSTGSERAALLFYVSPEQLNLQIPPGTAAGMSAVSVKYKGAKIATGNVEVATVAPGVFTANSNGNGVAAAAALRVKPDGTQIYEPVAELNAEQTRFIPRPIDLGPEGDQIILVIFGTGWRFRTSESAVKVTIGGIDLPVIYAGDQRTYTGLDQINVLLPQSLAGRGVVDLVVTADNKSSRPVTVSIK